MYKIDYNEFLDKVHGCWYGKCLCDAADMLNAPLLSWPSDEPRIKIDYIFVSPDLNVKFTDIPANTTSDHRPHIAEI